MFVREPRYPFGTRAGAVPDRRNASCSGAGREPRKLPVAPPELFYIDRRRDIRIEGIHVLDRVDRVDTRKRGIESVLDPGSRAVGSVEDLPRGRETPLRVDKRGDRLLPLLILHRSESAGRRSASASCRWLMGRTRVSARVRPHGCFFTMEGPKAVDSAGLQGVRPRTTRWVLPQFAAV